MKRILLFMIALILLSSSGFANDHKKQTPQSRHDTYMGYAETYRQKAVKIDADACKVEGDKAVAYKSIAEVYRLMANEKENMAKAYLAENTEAGKEAQARYAKLRVKRSSLETQLCGRKKTGKKDSRQKVEKKEKKCSSEKQKLDSRNKEISELKEQLKKLTKRLEAVEAQ